MAVVIKHKPTVAEPLQAIPSEHADKIDQIGLRYKELEKLEAKVQELVGKEMKRITALAKQLKEDEKLLAEALTLEYQAEDPDKVFTLEGAKFALELGKAANKREVTDIKAAANELGEDEFWKLCKLNLGDLDKYLNPAQLELCVTSSKGVRKIAITPKV